MNRGRFRRDADFLLGSLQWTPADTNRVLSELRGEQPKMKRKMRIGLVMAIVLVLLTAVALATGLVFSPRYSAVQLADKALEAKYGIQPAMLTIFCRADVVKDKDGNDVFTYASAESQWAEQIGVYTVTVHGQGARAVWSHDGEPTSEGLSSPVWSASQIRVILNDYAAACEAVLNDCEPEPTPSPEQIAANERRRQENASISKARAKITPEEAHRLALEAIVQVYSLTDSQLAALSTADDEYSFYYTVENDNPVLCICYALTQSADGEYTDGDGQYWVTINVETGTIEDVLYDSGLASNG